MVIAVNNLDKCIKKFGDISGIDMTPPMKDGALKVQKEAKNLAPVGTEESTGIKGYVGGTLKNSIRRKTYKKQQSAIVYTVTEYAPHIEFGTKYMKAQPFLTPAMKNLEKEIEKDTEKYIQSQLKKKT